MKKQKQKIPASLRQMVWLRYNSEKFRAKCQVSWCQNLITPFTFEVGHNQPESKGGTTTIDNLMPICTSCNRSMSNTYSITEYSERFANLHNPLTKRPATPATPATLATPAGCKPGLFYRLLRRFRCITPL